MDTTIEMHDKHDIPAGAGAKYLNFGSDDISSLVLASCKYLDNISLLQFSHMKISVNEIRHYHMFLTFWYSLPYNSSFVEMFQGFLALKSIVLVEDFTASFYVRVDFVNLRSLRYLETNVCKIVYQKLIPF